MRAVVQRVSEASVAINGTCTAKINHGMLVLIGIETDDTRQDSNWLSGKIVQLRIFDDENNVMNRSVLDTGGEIMIISQFTLHAKTKKGNRPSYIRAARPETAIPLYNYFIDETERLLGKKVKTGEFGAMMQVSLVNDGPVTIIIDSKERE